MTQISLGNSDLKISRVGLGTNNFGGRLDLEGSRKVIDAAIEQGITFFDTADVYGNRGGSETIIGEVLGERRKQIVLATKFGLPFDDSGQSRGASAAYIVHAVEASLKRLRTDWIDLYQLHRPDPDTPLEETLKALDALVTSGKVRYIGASNLLGWQVAQAQHLARELGTTRFISSQDGYSLLRRRVDPLLAARQRPFDRQVSAWPASAGWRASLWRANATNRAPSHRTQFAGGRTTGGVCEIAWARAGGACVQLACGAAGGEQHHRRCDHTGAGASEHRRCELETKCRRAG